MLAAHGRGQRLAGLDALDQRLVDRDARGHRRPRRRDDRVDGDLRARELHRPRPREGHDPGLGRGVVRLAEVAVLAGGRADDDDPAALALLAHPHRRRARARERAAQVRPDDEVEVLVGHLPQHLVAQHARVGDHDVQPAELLTARATSASARGGADGTGHGDRLAAARAPRSPRRRRVDVVDDHRRARGGERHRVGATEPAAAAGDDGDLPVQSMALMRSTGTGTRRRARAWGRP